MSKRIVVIDDEYPIRKSFQLALEDSGYRLDTAESGQQGIEMFTAAPYDLVFLDLKMPGMNGVETLRALRRIDQKVPIYIVTAFYGEFFDELESLAQQGIHFEVLQKPVDADQILMVARGVLEGPVVYDG